MVIFGRAFVSQRLINQALYRVILLLQKFNDIGGKVLKLPTSEKNEALFLVLNVNFFGDLGLELAIGNLV